MRGILQICLMVVFVIGIIIGGGYSDEIKSVFQEKTPVLFDTERTEQKPRTADEVYSGESSELREVIVYRASSDGQTLVKEEYTVAKTDETIAQAMGLLLAEPSDSANWSTIPDGTKVRSIHFSNGIARIDFSPEIVRNFRGGSAGEMLLVGSIVNTLTEIRGVEKVRIMVNGKQIETLGGHLDLSEPVARMENLIGK